MNKNTSYVTKGAIIAALYVVLTMISTAAGMSSGVIQIRISEALCILPVFTPAAVPGLFVGCIIANIMSGCLPWDVVFGSLATLLGAIGTAKLRNTKYLCLAPPIISNTLIVPWVLSLVYHFEGSILYFSLTVFIGEFVSAGILSYMLKRLIEKRGNTIDW